MKKRVRVGLYMFTPMIGGAETHFKDLLWNLNRDAYDITLFLEPWAEFETFLELDKCPKTRICRVHVFEPNGHFGAREPVQINGQAASQRLESLLSQFRSLIAGRLVGSNARAIGRLILRFGGLPLNTLSLMAAFSKHRIDVLHVVNGGYPGALSCQAAPLAAKLAGYKTCIMSICNTPAPITAPKVVERILDRCVALSVKCVLSPADILSRAVVSRWPSVHSKLRRLPYGVIDPIAFAEYMEVSRKGNVNQRHTGGLSITMAASFLPHKGHLYLLEAFHTLRKTFPDTQLILIGDGPTKDSVQDQVQLMGLGDSVVFAGFLPLAETLKRIEQTTLVVHPSDLEGVPYVILHAMSLGKPIIATCVGGVSEAIVPNESGILIPPADPERLGEALLALLADPELRSALGRNARAAYEANFSRDRMIRRHEELYSELCK